MNTRTLTISIILGALLFATGYMTRGYVSGQKGAAANHEGGTVHPVNEGPKDPQKLTEALQTEINRLKLELESTGHAHPQNELVEQSGTSTAERYSRLVEHLKKNDLYKLRFDEDLQPTEFMVEFLGLNDYQANRLKAVCKQAFNELADFESQNAVVLDQTENMLSYEIPALPEEYIVKFTQSLGSVIHEDDLELVSAIALRNLKKSATKKVVTFQINTKENGQENFTLKVEYGNRSTNSTSGSYRGSHQLPVRWRHLFQIDE